MAHAPRSCTFQNLKEMAATCIFLAAKIEECSRKAKDVALITMAKNSAIAPETIDQQTNKVRPRSETRV